MRDFSSQITGSVSITDKTATERAAKKHLESSQAVILIAKLSAQEKRLIVLKLAQSWAKPKEYGKSIAVVWTAIPLDGKTTSAEAPVVKELLQLIILNAEVLNSKTDKDHLVTCANALLCPVCSPRIMGIRGGE